MIEPAYGPAIQPSSALSDSGIEMMDTAGKLKVFISYSRRDSSGFAGDLVDGMRLAGFSPIIDRNDIAPGEDWEARLGVLIDESDSVVFVISPEAIKSERCAWEVERALAQSKRLLPIIYKSVSLADIPEQLRRLQFVHFDAHPDITKPLTQLADALRHDLEWIREHTRLGDIAARWHARGQLASLLLRGEELEAAKAWAKKRRPDAPQITKGQRAFLDASEGMEASRLVQLKSARKSKRLTRVLVGALLLAVGSLFLGWANEAYVVEQWRWFTRIRSYVTTQVRPFILSEEKERSLRAGETFVECAGKEHCPEMVVIPEGVFVMGSPRQEKGRSGSEEPLHFVFIAKPFAVSKFETTFEQWDACVAYGDCSPNIRDSGFGRGRLPVTDVTWDDAQKFVAWLSAMTGKPYRLLTEAEWEYATRARTLTPYPWGNEIGQGNANCSGCGSQWDMRPAPVGSFPANAFGLHDMNGNVREWVEDCFHPNYAGAPRDGSAWTSPGCRPLEKDSTQPAGLHVVRGGGWGFQPEMLRSASRPSRTAGSKDINLGFRVARTLAR